MNNNSNENIFTADRIDDKNAYLFLLKNPVKIIKNSMKIDNKFRYNKLYSNSKKIKFGNHKTLIQNK